MTSLANPASLSVTSSPVAITAPVACNVVTIQQEQGDSSLHPFQPLLADGATANGPVQQGGANFQIAAPQGQSFAAGQVVGYVELLSADTATVVFSVFANPSAPGQIALPQVLGQRATVILTSAQLLALQTTAIQIVPPPGNGFYLRPGKLSLQFKPKTTAYTIANADNAFRLEYVGKTTSLIAPLATGLVDQTVGETIDQAPAVGQTVLARTAVEGLGLELKLIGTTPALTLGDGTVQVNLDYSVIPLI